MTTTFSRRIRNSRMSPLLFATWDFLQYGILTLIETGESVETPFTNRNSKCCSPVAYHAANIQAIIKGSDHGVRIVCAGWSEPLHITHTTLMEISCCGSYMDLFDAPNRNAPTSYNWLILLWSQKQGCLLVLRRIRKLNSNSQHPEVAIHYIFKESVNLQSLVFKYISLRK